MPKSIILFILFCFCMQIKLFAQQYSDLIVVIDPGHGGVDPGKPRGVSYYSHEKDLNLSIALKLGDYLEAKIPNIKVIYTRTTDIYVSLEDRVSFANQNKANYFISIHCNASPYKNVYGSSTHIHSNQGTSRKLAELIESEFANKLNRKSLGVKDTEERGYSLYVLKYTKMPSVLVESGFMSNAEEEKYLNSDEGQIYIAAAIYRAFHTFVQGRVLSSSNKTISSGSVVYKVQIAASDKAVYLKSSKYQNLNMNIEEFIDGTAKYPYKYFVGKTTDINIAKELAKKVQSLGFPDAFIVKF